MPDKLLNYDVLRQLGEGAGSFIYLVRDPGTGRTFALKHIKRDKPKDIRFIEQVEAEFEISRQFTHRNLRKTYDLKINKSMLLKVTEAYLVMEYVEGKPLDVRPAPTVMETLVIFMHVAMGLRAMHQLGYVHCDIKPNNILCDDAGSVRVIDFGQSCRIGTIKERIQGTPDYIAPEQVNREPVTVQTDVYNLGATLYWALTGKNSPTLYTVNRQGENSFLLDSTIQTPADLNPIVTPALSKLVMDCISTRREKRPADMDAVLSRLELARYAMKKRPADSTPDPMDSSIMPAPSVAAAEATPKPAAEALPQPAVEAPSLPAAENASQPAVEPARRPAAEVPSRLAAEPASQVPVEVPSRPAAEASSRPAVESASRAAGQVPSQAPVEAASRPAAAVPSRPAGKAPSPAAAETSPEPVAPEPPLSSEVVSQPQIRNPRRG